MKTTYTRLGITFWSNDVDVKQVRPMDLFAIAQDIFDADGARLENGKVAAKLKKMGRASIEIVRHPKYKFTLTAK